MNRTTRTNMHSVKPYHEKLQDPRWQRKRTEVLTRDNFTCRDCGASDKTLHVHHCLYAGEPWDVHSDALLTLCKDCHARRGEVEKEAKRNLSLLFATMTWEQTHRFATSIQDHKDGFCTDLVVRILSDEEVAEYRRNRA